MLYTKINLQAHVQHCTHRQHHLPPNYAASHFGDSQSLASLFSLQFYEINFTTVNFKSEIYLVVISIHGKIKQQ